ncbi:MAG: hypothetical protein QOK61_04080, partial [Nitrososphaeraceae archaeon]|nr:hypothetical protein [Nitrososphaeraceae archaeon]
HSLSLARALFTNNSFEIPYSALNATRKILLSNCFILSTIFVVGTSLRVLIPFRVSLVLGLYLLECNIEKSATAAA